MSLDQEKLPREKASVSIFMLKNTERTQLQDTYPLKIFFVKRLR